MHIVRRFFIIVIFILFNLISATTSFSSQPTCPQFPFYQPKSGPVAIANCDFHKLYEQRVLAVKKTLGIPHGRPVILNLGGDLFFKFNGKTEKIIIQPAAYHFLKSFSHIGFSVYLILSQQPAGKLNSNTLTSLQLLNQQIINSEQIIPTLHLSKEVFTICNNLLRDIHHFIQTLLTNQQFSQAELADFYTKLRPQLYKSTYMASFIELSLLDKAVTRFLAQLTDVEKSQLAILVATVHQARAQEISTQYFAKKFDKHFSEGAINENGLVLLEGKFDEESALTLLARHYLDREAAQVIFNDPDHLQRDVLADATKEILRHKKRASE